MDDPAPPQQHAITVRTCRTPPHCLPVLRHLGPHRCVGAMRRSSGSSGQRPQGAQRQRFAPLLEFSCAVMPQTRASRVHPTGRCVAPATGFAVPHDPEPRWVRLASQLMYWLTCASASLLAACCRHVRVLGSRGEARQWPALGRRCAALYAAGQSVEWGPPQGGCTGINCGSRLRGALHRVLCGHQSLQPATVPPVRREVACGRVAAVWDVPESDHGVVHAVCRGGGAGAGGFVPCVAHRARWPLPAMGGDTADTPTCPSCTRSSWSSPSAVLRRA